MNLNSNGQKSCTYVLPDKRLFSLALRISTFALSFAAVVSCADQASAACGATNITWTGSGSTSWTKTSNWSTANIPDTSSENAIIVNTGSTPGFSTSYTLGCLDIQSGFMTVSNRTLTIAGDYFRNLTAGAMTVATNSTFAISMSGTAAQTFENLDAINYLTITNPTTVTFTQPFIIRNTLTLSGSATTLNVNGDLELQSTTALTIPANNTVNVASGKTLTALGGITINGTLVLNPGARLVVGSGKTISVAAGGLLSLSGSAQSPITVTGYGNATYGVTVAGSLNASYFRFEYLNSTGVSVTGTVQAMTEGTFHHLAANGYGLTLGAAASIPTTISGLGFYNDDSNSTVKNINATAYTGSAITINLWSGDVGGAASETDPSSKITWGTQAGVELNVFNNTASGFPATPIAQSSGPALFATFGFSLTGTSTATNITQLTITLSGTATTGDIANIKVYKDVTGGVTCAYDSGVDTQIGSDLTLSGTPGTATLTIPTGAVQASGPTAACVHVLVTTTATASNAKTIAMKIASTADVTNSQGYSIAISSAPPVTAPSATITGDATSTWDGSSSVAWATSQNWTPATVPTTARDCKIGVGLNQLSLSANVGCQNVTFSNNGQMTFNTYEISATALMDIGTGYTFTSSTAGTIAMRGANNQSLNIGTAFPGNLIIGNTGTSPNNTVDGNYLQAIMGNLTVSSGRLKIGGSQTLDVYGDIIVSSGATLDIEPGGALVMHDNKTLTVNSGGTLEMIGASGDLAAIRSNVNTAAIGIAVYGTIRAQYYSLANLGTNGLTINSGATIDATYYLQNGSYIYPVGTGTTMLRLFKKIPGDTLTNMIFDLNGSSAGGTKAITTDASLASGTLTISSYSGNLGGPSFSTGTTYLVAWSGATNTINVTQDATTPASLNQGQTYTMGRYRFVQSQAGASFANTDITSLKLTLTGTANSNEISAVRIYFDSSCAGSGGTLIGTGTFSGTPSTVTFSLGAGVATIPASITSPAAKCIYVQYDISATATNAHTAGVSIASSSDMVNSLNYGWAAGTPAPVTLGNAGSIIGTSTVWTGTTNTNWFTSTNWNGGVPTSSLNCQISSATNAPVINGTLGTAVCKTVSLVSGTLSMTNATGAVLEVYGDFNASGTFTPNDGIVKIRDNGTVATNQTVTSGSTLNLSFNKTAAGGTVQIGGTTLTLNSLTMPSGSSFNMITANAKNLVLLGGATINAGTFEVQGGGTVKVASGQTISMTGGGFVTTGTNDAFPQTTTNKAKITNNGSGRWGFVSTGGSVSLTGFLIDNLDVNGFRINGATNFSALNGGQFSYLINDFTTPVKAW